MEPHLDNVISLYLVNYDKAFLAVVDKCLSAPLLADEAEFDYLFVD